MSARELGRGSHRADMRQPGLCIGIVVMCADVLVQVCGEIFCHCNLAACVSTGYMCKSRQELCFWDQASAWPSDVTGSGPYHWRYGCVDLLADSEARSYKSAGLQDVGDAVGHSAPHERWDCNASLGDEVTGGARVHRRCCNHDMCNFDKDYRDGAPGSHSGRDFGEPIIAAGSLTRLLWFRAAVIAVPITGGFVLVLLVLLASRLLRRDADLPSQSGHLVHGMHEPRKASAKSLVSCLRGLWPAKTDKSVVLV